MKTIRELLVAGMLLATACTGLGQAPVITLQPTNQTACRGTDVTFAVGASGAEPLSYCWQKSSNNLNYYDLPDCTNATLVLSNVQAADAIYYLVIVTNVDGAVTSAGARLTLAFPPSILASGQPANWGASVGASAANRVVASGTAPLTYQWRFNGVPISGQTKSSIILTNIQVADAGDYDVVVANQCGSITSRTNTLMVDANFTKIMTGVIVTDSEASVSGSWADYDGDGFVDLFVANTLNSSTAHNTLYRNNGGTNFSRIAGPVPTDVMDAWTGSWADYDNDGNVDLVYAGIDGGLLAQRLFHNNGNGTFTPLLDSALRSDTATATCPWWLDYDNDGFVDLFVTKGTPWGGAANDCLFRNNGDGTFKKATVAEVGALLSDAYMTDGVLSADYDNDGSQELTVVHRIPKSGGAYDFIARTWRPQADGTFASVAVGMPANAIVFWWGDYDNDDRLDCFALGLDTRPMLFRNLGGSGFTNVTAALQGTVPVPGYQASWGDYDNDGWLDLFFTGVYGYSTNTLNGFYHNNRDGTFTQILTGSPVYDGDRRCSPNWIDYDNDGFLDLFVAGGDGEPAPNRLYHNNTNGNHWLKIKLDGRVSNRSGIGAKVRAQATVNGQTFWQVREISCGNGYPGQNGLLAHFGLGDATNVATLEIKWPSGILQQFTNIPANQFLTLIEHAEYGGPRPAFAGTKIVTDGVQISITEPTAGARYILEGSTNLVSWTKLMARTSAGASAQFTDTRMANYARRFYRLQVP